MLCDLPIGPLPGRLWIATEYEVCMVRHDVVGVHGNRKAVSKLEDPIFDPLTPMFEILARLREKSYPNGGFQNRACSIDSVFMQM